MHMRMNHAFHFCLISLLRQTSLHTRHAFNFCPIAHRPKTTSSSLTQIRKTQSLHLPLQHSRPIRFHCLNLAIPHLLQLRSPQKFENSRDQNSQIHSLTPPRSQSFSVKPCKITNYRIIRIIRLWINIRSHYFNYPLLINIFGSFFSNISLRDSSHYELFKIR